MEELSPFGWAVLIIVGGTILFTLAYAVFDELTNYWKHWLAFVIYFLLLTGSILLLNYIF